MILPTAMTPRKPWKNVLNIVKNVGILGGSTTIPTNPKRGRDN
jgi:hypothetical protein